MSILSVPEELLRRRSSLKWRTFPQDVLPLWVAEMDVLPHPAVREALDAALDLGDTGYPHGTAYAQAFSAMAQRRWDWAIDVATQVKQSGDVMNAILAVLTGLTAPGDAVVINPPVYAPFRAVSAGYGRTIREVPLSPEGRLDLAGLEAAFTQTPRPTTYLLCSPHNPTGTVHTREELEAVMSLANRHGVRVIVDEIHAVLVDAGTTFTPIITVPGGERAIVATSAGKAWNLAGFKAGLIVTGPEATDLWSCLPPLATQSAGHLGVIAHTAALTHAQEWADALMVEVTANKRLLHDLLAEQVPAARYSIRPGTYLAWVDCSDLGLNHPAGHFLSHGRVAFNRGSDYASTHGQFVRINLATSPVLITEAVRRMAASLAKRP